MAPRSNKKKKGRKKDAKKKEQPECNHGLVKPPAESHTFRVQVHLFEMYKDFLLAANKGEDHPITAMEKLMYERPDIVVHPDATPVGLCYATNMLLGNEDTFDERIWRLERWLLQGIIHIEKGSTITDADGNMYDRETTEQRMKKMQKRFCKLETKRDMVEWLDNKIPCNCLAGIKERILQEPDLRQCEHCGKLDPNLTMCPLCKISQYCSEDCQQAAWPDHKYRCKLFNGEIPHQELERIKCDECGKLNKNTKRCARCRLSKYCSVECQAAAWPEHKDQCNQKKRAASAEKGETVVEEVD